MGILEQKYGKIIDGIYEKLIWIHMKMKPNVACGTYSFSFPCPLSSTLSFVILISSRKFGAHLNRLNPIRIFKVKSISNGKMKTIVEIFSYDNIVFTTYIAWSSILVMKMMCMSLATAIQRIKTRVSWIFLLCKSKNVCFSGMKRDRRLMNTQNCYSRQLQRTRFLWCLNIKYYF